MTEQLKNRPGDQPLPVGGGQPVMPVLMEMLRAREVVGIERYGTPLRANNGRNSLRDAIEEAVDQVVYLTQLDMETKGGRFAVYTQISSELRRFAVASREEREAIFGVVPVVSTGSASRLADFIDAMGVREEGAQEPSEFFVMGCTYEHAAEGVFLVKYVGRPPEGFEYPSEALGVAFGWRRDAREGAAGVLVGSQGAYDTADFAGWELYL